MKPVFKGVITVVIATVITSVVIFVTGKSNAEQDINDIGSSLAASGTNSSSSDKANHPAKNESVEFSQDASTTSNLIKSKTPPPPGPFVESSRIGNSNNKGLGSVKSLIAPTFSSSKPIAPEQKPSPKLQQPPALKTSPMNIPKQIVKEEVSKKVDAVKSVAPMLSSRTSKPSTTKAPVPPFPQPKAINRPQKPNNDLKAPVIPSQPQALRVSPVAPEITKNQKPNFNMPQPRMNKQATPLFVYPYQGMYYYAPTYPSVNRMPQPNYYSQPVWNTYDYQMPYYPSPSQLNINSANQTENQIMKRNPSATGKK